jgi:hypothetical protein
VFTVWDKYVVFCFTGYERYIEKYYFFFDTLGCEGGFPYLIGGKYAEDFGLVLEECNPYTGRDGACSTKKDCPRMYSTKYEYIGGYYGAYVTLFLYLILPSFIDKMSKLRYILLNSLMK